MSHITLFEVARDFREVADKLADLNLDEQTIRDTLEGESTALVTKGANVGFVIRNLEASAEAIKAAEADMAARRKAIENRAKSLHGYLLMGMQYAAIERIDTPYFAISIRKNPPAVAIDEPGLIPTEYMVQPEPPPPAPDKKAIAVALKSGMDVPGCRLMQGERVEIK